MSNIALNRVKLIHVLVTMRSVEFITRYTLQLVSNYFRHTSQRYKYNSLWMRLVTKAWTIASSLTHHRVSVGLGALTAVITQGAPKK